MFEEGAALKKIHGAENIFDFSLGNPDLSPPPAFHKTLLELVNEETPGVHGYMPNAGYPETRAAIAEKVSAEHGVLIDSSHVIMSVGAAGALNTVFKAILNPADEVIVNKPYFMEYRAYAKNHRGNIIEVETEDDFNLNLEGIRSALSNETAAVLINSPNNPTGRVYTSETLKALSAILSLHGEKTGRYPYLIADEPYREIVFNGIKTAPVLNAYKNSIVVSSYSKSLSLAGERIGYIALSPDADEAALLAEALIYATRVLGFVNAPALMQRCVERLTKETVNIAVYRERRDAFKQVLDAVDIHYAEPEGAFYIFAKVPHRKGRAAQETDAGEDDLAFCEHLKKYLILGVPGAGFGKKGWMRFAYCVNDKLIKASADAFKKALAAWRGEMIR
jgi:aspartate aminotransferase